MLDVLAEFLIYEPETGEFYWRIDRANQPAGKLAGNIGPNGYRTICVNYKSYYAHHLVLIFSGRHLPTKGEHVDHINGDKSDNRLLNLRVVTAANNCRNRTRLNKNNSSGATGVRRTRGGKYVAVAMFNRKNKRIGLFTSLEEAKAAREAYLVGL